jgi:hypothetical protein
VTSASRVSESLIQQSDGLDCDRAPRGLPWRQQAMLENLHDMEGLKCETAAGDKSQSTSCLCCAVQPMRLALVAGFALLFLCNHSKLEGALTESADNFLHPRPPSPQTHQTINKDLYQPPRTATCHALRTRHMARLLLPEVRLSSILPSNCAYLEPPSIQIRHSTNLSCHDSRGAPVPSGQGTMR